MADTDSDEPIPEGAHSEEDRNNTPEWIRHIFGNLETWLRKGNEGGGGGGCRRWQRRVVETAAGGKGNEGGGGGSKEVAARARARRMAEA